MVCGCDGRNIIRAQSGRPEPDREQRLGRPQPCMTGRVYRSGRNRGVAPLIDVILRACNVKVHGPSIYSRQSWTNIPEF